MECAGMFQPVFVLSGCCQGLEIGLDTEAIAFGTGSKIRVICTNSHTLS